LAPLIVRREKRFNGSTFNIPTRNPLPSDLYRELEGGRGMKLFLGPVPIPIPTMTWHGLREQRVRNAESGFGDDDEDPRVDGPWAQGISKTFENHLEPLAPLSDLG
jgi:hypothetical protein